MAKNSRTGYGLGKGGPEPQLAPMSVNSKRNPSALDKNYELQTIWINEISHKAFICTGPGVWQAVGGGGGGGVIDYANIQYVSSTGDDSNSGLNIGEPVKTIGQAIINATAMVPSASNRVCIYIQDAGPYTGSFTLPSYVDIYAPETTINGQINVTDNSKVNVGIMNVTTGQVAITKNTGAPLGITDVYVREMNCNGTSVGVICTAGIINFEWDKMVVQNGFGIGDLTSSLRPILLRGNLLVLNGTGCGIARASSNSTQGAINTIVDLLGTGTAIKLTAGGADLTVNRIQVDTAYDIDGAGTTVNLLAVGIDGTRIVTGGASDRVWEVPDTSVAGQVLQGQGPGVKASWATFIAGVGATISTPTGTINIAAPGVDNVKTFYVGKHGFDTNTGLTLNQAFKTFGAAALAATAASPSYYDRCVIVCVDNGLYTEDVTITDYVSVYAPNIMFQGIWIMGDYCHVKIGTHIVPNQGVSYNGANMGSIEADQVLDTGLGASWVNAGGSSGSFYAKCKQLSFSSGSAFVNQGNSDGFFEADYVHVNTATTSAVLWNVPLTPYTNNLYAKIKKMSDSSGAATAAQVSTGGGIYLDCDVITGFGLGFLTEVANSYIMVKANKIEAETVYDSSLGGDIRITANNEFHTLTSSGFAAKNMAVKWQYTNVNLTMSLNSGYIVFLNAPELLLPASPEYGDTVEVSLAGGTSWKITQNASQYIIVDTNTSTSGVTGYVMSNSTGAAITLKCIEPPYGWQAMSVVGSVTVV